MTFKGPFQPKLFHNSMKTDLNPFHVHARAKDRQLEHTAYSSPYWETEYTYNISNTYL